MHTSLECSLTGEFHEPDRLQGLSRAGKPLLARYDLGALGGWTPEIVRSRRERSMWKFHEVLPVNGLSEAVTLGEGLTPFLKCVERGVFAGFGDLWVKDEGFNPTQSFKARGMSAAMTRAAAFGVQTVALPSAGNAAGAATAYAARAGIRCVIFVPEDTPPANILESACGGAQVVLVNGLISDCGRLCRAACDRFGWFDLSTLKEPFRLEGKKTMGYELAEQLAWSYPDWIIYPTGGGTGMVGMWKAFEEMERIGWMTPGRRPKMVTVQASGCQPIVRAFEQGTEKAAMWENAATVADGLRVPRAIGDFLILRAIRESGGTALAVPDAEMVDGMIEIGSAEGVSAAPEGGAALAAIRHLVKSGAIKRHETVVLFNTGGALKYLDVLRG